MPGPLTGIKVVEFAGIGPAPFCAMLLADMGAEVIRIERPGPAAIDFGTFDLLVRGRPSITLDLKTPSGAATALRMAEHADALIEGYRPGTMERLGLGPQTCLERNPRLVYGRVTGWGQDGPLAQAAGHDINYIALSGALAAIGERDGAPVPPLNLVGDFGGGGMLLAIGVLCALLEARGSARGQVVDAAMIDGAALQMAAIYGLRAGGKWSGGRGENFLDGGAHFYRPYRCRDGKWIAIGAIEAPFYRSLIDKVGATDPAFRVQWDERQWPALSEKLAAIFATRGRDEWCALLEGSDACFAPVLDFDEAPYHPHNRARGTFVEVDGAWLPGPAPRFGRTTPDRTQRSTAPMADEQLLARFGVRPRDLEPAPSTPS